MGRHTVEIREPGRPPRQVVLERRLEIGRECDGELVHDPEVSRRHLALEIVEGDVTVSDLGSSNGTTVDGSRIVAPMALRGGEIVRFGRTELVLLEPEPAPALTPAPAPAPAGGARVTVALHPTEAVYLEAERRRAAAVSAGDLTPELVSTPEWSDDAVGAAGIPIVDADLVTVGGGLGSFALTHVLRVAGVAPERIAVLSPLSLPHQTYEYLAGASQIRAEDRLRSDSMSRIDNLWGFPSYALEEAIAAKRLKPLWQVLTEPILSEFYNPQAGRMYKGVEREAKRIGWAKMVHTGQVRMVRRRRGGGYFAVLTPPPGAGQPMRIAFRATFAHIAVGYPSLRFLPDLQAYRARYGDFHRVINAYEPHEHVYESLRRAPGTVLLRGAGIVASRILERLAADRDAGAQTQIVHLFRTYVAGPTGGRTFRRQGGDGFTYQPFTFAKAAGSGQLRQKAKTLEGDERAKFIKSIGGTTTAKRKVWQDQLGRGRREGWYRSEIGEVRDVRPSPDGRKVVTTVQAGDGPRVDVEADFIIDATGLEGDVRDHRLLADLLENGGAGVNALGRLDVNHHFEIRGTQSDAGRLYASGSIAGGGYLPPADSFWGVMHAAVEICDDLARHGFCSHLGAARSVAQWWKWVRNTPI